MSTKDLSPALPAKFTTVFGARRCAGNPDAGFARSYSKDVLLSSITPTDTNITPVPLGTSGTTWTFRDTALALYSTPGAAPSNQAAIDALAKQLAQDAVDFLSQSFDIVYNGVAAVPPNALVDILEVAYGPEDLTTRIRSAPWNGSVVEFQHLDPAISACQADDRSPGLLVDVPGASVGNSMQGVLSLEDGRLVMTYDNTMTLNCGCTTTPPCGSICTQVTGCSTAVLTGATVTVTLNQVVSIAVTNGGTGYTSAPGVVIAGTNGTGATATAVLVGTVVDHIDVTNGGGYTATPLVSFSGGGGTGAAATATLGGATTIGTGTTTGQVTSITRTAAGSGYTSAPAVAIGTPGSGAAAVANMVATVASYTISNGGSGYTTAPTCTVSGSGGTGATGRPLLTATTVASVTPVTGGTYGGTPTVVFTTPTGHTGSGAAATAVMSGGGSGSVIGFTMTNNGTNYSTSPTVSFTGGTPTVGATATAVCTATSVASITVVLAGSNYTAPPNVVFAGGGGGSGAVAVAVLNPFTVGSFTVTAGGSGYSASSLPSITLSGGGGSGASGTAVVRVQYCVPITTAGRYVVSGAATNYTTTSNNVTVSPCSTGSSPSIGLTPATGFSCLQNPCCDPADYTSGPPYTTSIAPPATIFMTDPFGTVTLTQINPTEWGGCAVRTATLGAIATPACTGGPVTGPVTLYFDLSCGSGGHMVLDISADNTTCTSVVFFDTPGSCLPAHTVLIPCTYISSVFDCLSFGGSIAVSNCAGSKLNFIYGGSFTLTFSS